MALLNDLTDLLLTEWKESNLSPPSWVAKPETLKRRRNQTVRDVAKKEAAKLMSRFIFREIAGGRPQNGMKQCEAAAAARVDPLIPSNPEQSATWPELQRLFTDTISSWWECNPFTPAVAGALSSWIGKCRDAAQEVADETRDLKTDSDGLTEGQVSYWTETTSDGPMRVFECVFKGRSIVKYRGRVHISAGHVETLHSRFRCHGPAFAHAASAQHPTGVTVELFHLRLFSMLLRYESLFFLDQGTQGALPNRAFQHLQVCSPHLLC